MIGERVPGAAAWAASVGVEATIQEGRQLGRAAAGPWAPSALRLRARDAGAAGSGRLGALVAAGIVADWVEDRPRLDPPTYAALRLAEESARGAGIWIACVRARDFRALRPRRPPHPSRR